MEQEKEEIIAECKRQQESCTYTVAALHSWLNCLRVWRVLFVVVPIILGGLASFKLLLADPNWEWISAVSALLAGLFPAIYKALNLDVSIPATTATAHEFEKLRDRFRQAARIGATKPISELESQFNDLMDRMDSARSACPSIPEDHFEVARQKIKNGHFNFSVDE
jgi:hypothetical protein